MCKYSFFHLENKTNSDFYVTAAFSFNLQKYLISAVKWLIA